ncbi:hypothetical protein NPIL_625401 [Nephila pilipes]|uniref:Uncharacterized protein n=1 Tax=Nephila pilipes TaxID=299642 RepID=A0A8X6U4J0_NEPPI|nr:hypothetical protein NPIL_625401 [Nephila pilipes]
MLRIGNDIKKLERFKPHEVQFLGRKHTTLFKKYNERPHVARVVKGCLHHMQGLPWLSRYWDLREHVWYQMKRVRVPFHNIRNLERTLQQVCPSIV